MSDDRQPLLFDPPPTELCEVCGERPATETHHAHDGESLRTCDAPACDPGVLF